MKAKIGLMALLLTLGMSAHAAELISKEEATHYKLSKISNISISATQGEISSPTELHEALSKMADEKGGKYYVIVAAREHGPNFEAVAIVYK